MAEESWTVLREHLMSPFLLSMDGQAVEMLSLQAELENQGIETAFDPYRPGEGPGWSRSLEQPFRLLVREVDLTRAQEIAAAFDATDAADFELDEDFEDFGEPVE